MNYTLQDLEQLKQGKKDKEAQALEDRHEYLQGKKGYPTAPVESLTQDMSERQKTCYIMGYNTAEWENNRGN